MLVDRLIWLCFVLLSVHRYPRIQARVEALQQWHRAGGMLLIGYELFRGLIEPGEKATARTTDPQHPQQLRTIRHCLCSPGPDLLVLDEGHRLRSPTSLLFRAMARVHTRRRVVLTGYPLQNHLDEYYCMVNFVCPGVLGSRSSFRDKFEHPIRAGSARDSDPRLVSVAQRRTYVLSCLLRPYVMRRGVQYLKRVLPPKTEWVVYCRLSPFQARLYRAFLRARRDLDEQAKQAGHGHSLVVVRDGVLETGKKKTNSRGGLLAAYHTSLMINNHPDILHTALQVRCVLP